MKHYKRVYSLINSINYLLIIVNTGSIPLNKNHRFKKYYQIIQKFIYNRILNSIALMVVKPSPPLEDIENLIIQFEK